MLNRTGIVSIFSGGDSLLAEAAPDGTVTTVNIWGQQGLLGRYDPAHPDGVVYYLPDPQGNVALRVDADRTVVSADLYDAYGACLAGNAGGDPYGYKGTVGYYTDAATGLILCTHRYYDPATGRWLTRDPIGYDGGLNVYAYCGGDPVNGVDPSGLERVTLHDYGYWDYNEESKIFTRYDDPNTKYQNEAGERMGIDGIVWSRDGKKKLGKLSDAGVMFINRIAYLHDIGAYSEEFTADFLGICTLNTSPIGVPVSDSMDKFGNVYQTVGVSATRYRSPIDHTVSEEYGDDYTPSTPEQSEAANRGLFIEVQIGPYQGGGGFGGCGVNRSSCLPLQGIGGQITYTQPLSIKLRDNTRHYPPVNPRLVGDSPCPSTYYLGLMYDLMRYDDAQAKNSNK